MSPPPAARGRTALGRLVDALRRRLGPDAVAEPGAVGEATDEPARSDIEPGAGDADARFDAARERLRARIEPPAPDGGD